MTAPDWILANGERLQVIVFFALLPALAALERLVPRRPGPMDRSRRWPANLFLTVLNLVALGAIPVSFVGASIWARDRGWGLLDAIGAPAAAAAAATLLLRASLSYFTHLLMHKVPWLWRLHRVHHMDPELDVATTARFHPLEFAAATAIGVPFVAAFGLTPWALALYEILDAAVTVWSHSNVHLPERLDRVLRYAVVTPDLHRVHHSWWQPETDSHFGAVFPVWDLVFGTFRPVPRDGHERMRLGLGEADPREAGRPLRLLASAFRPRAAGGRP
jgi:sterol desaturase/sphingolipid hydroxylase (fatty acid hydroxylase superfamily)